MLNLDQPACTSCGKLASSLEDGKKMLVCSRCQSQAQRLVHYCSRNCQVSHFKLHKPTCGVKLATRPEFPSIADPDAPFQPTQALLYHLAALSTLPPSASPNTPPPSFLYFPSNPLSDAASSSSKPPVMPIPISLPPPARNLFNCLSWVAFRTANPLSVVLMYSLLLTEIEALGGVEDRLVEQLSEEYRLDGVQELGGEKRRSLRRMLDDEDEPESEDLMVAIGGETNQGILVEWQMYEAERTRPTK
ncbi:chloride channel [Rhodotorula toruloides]|uniref:Chloride channel n=1 Tax=Rhodotorula toruloides TaxID=5286 RepID=A0A511KJ07_RHOTO|nr:chloride channel [Rhodotorula toruloides]